MISRPLVSRWCFAFFLLITFVAKTTASEPLVIFIALADAQHDARVAQKKNRRYDLTAQKMAFVARMAQKAQPDFIIHLGDWIEDGVPENYTAANQFRQLFDQPLKMVVGNNDLLENDPNDLSYALRNLRLVKPFYAFERSGIRFIVLNGNDPRPPDITQLPYYGNEQLVWLKEQLAAAAAAEQRVVLFSHFPAHQALRVKETSRALTEIIKQSPAVIAFFSGHYHTPQFTLDADIPFFVVPALVETTEASFAVVRIYADKIIVRGFGCMPNIAMPLRTAALQKPTASPRLRYYSH